MSQRIGPFFLVWECDSKNTFCQIWLEWNFFLANMTQNGTFLSMTQRIVFFKKKNDSKNWKLFNIGLEELILFHIIPILEPYFKIGSQNWFFKVILSIEFFLGKNTQKIERIEPFLVITQRIEFFFCWKYDSKNWTFLEKNSKCCFRWKYDSKNWTLFWYDSKNWTYFQYDSKYWIFQKKKIMTQKILFSSKKKTWLKELIFLMPKMDFFWKTLRNELFWTLLEELNPFQYVFKNSTLFLKKKKDSKNWTLLQYDSKILFFKYDSKIFFLNMTQRTELFFRYDTKDWTYLLNATQIIQPFFNVIQRVFSQKWL